MSGVGTVNPATGEHLARYGFTTEADLSGILDAAGAAIDRAPGILRAAKLRALADRLRANAGELAMLITTEMGKPIGQSRAEIEKCAVACEYYAERVSGLIEPRPVEVGPDRAAVHVRPLHRQPARGRDRGCAGPAPR